MPFLCFYFPLRMSFLLSVFCFSFFFSSTHSFHDDRQSLLAFKNDITDDPHASMANWSPAVLLCNWTAVTCSRRHVDRVVSLDLSDMDLGGSISPFLGNLSFLRKLNLTGNALRGHIPSQLGRLFRLRELSLRYNLLEGNIPKELGSLTHLQELSLGHNNLTGTIFSALIIFYIGFSD
jgi:receptor kinase-like protein